MHFAGVDGQVQSVQRSRPPERLDQALGADRLGHFCSYSGGRFMAERACSACSGVSKGFAKTSRKAWFIRAHPAGSVMSSPRDADTWSRSTKTPICIATRIVA